MFTRIIISKKHERGKLMNKQEVISKLKSAIPKNNVDDYQKGETAGLNFALLLLAELDEPEKPVVPQFVADWYEEHKDDIEYNLYNLCTDFRKQKLRVDLHVWFGDDNNKPIETLVKMKLFGYEVEYEVEKKKLYTVELPNPNKEEHPILYKNRDGKVCIIFPSVPCWREVKNAQLTESEIKEDFEWAWQFAKEVDE